MKRIKNSKENDKYTYFITSKHASIFTIKKLHICTWLYKNRTEVAEVGFQISIKDRNLLKEPPNDNQHRLIDLTAWIPWVTESIEIEDLYDAISNKENAQFIFNDNCKGADSLCNWNTNAGQLLKFEERGPLAVVRICCHRKMNGKLDLEMSIPVGLPDNADIYGRFCLRVGDLSVAFHNESFTHELYAYNINIGQLRNAPLGFPVEERCSIADVFCLHITPSDYRQTFCGPKSFINMRFLESNKYNKYIVHNTILNHQIKQNELIVSFNKISCPESEGNEYAFYTVFERDSSSTKQFWISILINLVAAILYGILVCLITYGNEALKNHI